MEMEKKEVVIDHYSVLGSPSGKEKALQLHPDKRLNDLNANAMFQRLNSSYAILGIQKPENSFSSLIRLDNKPSFKPNKENHDDELFLYIRYCPDDFSGWKNSRWFFKEGGLYF
ncbi:hypothetical protein ACLB2K_034794 [Fragaria x ananassa]